MNERRNAWFLIALLLGQLLLLSAQLPDPTGGNRLEALLLRGVAVPAHLVAGAGRFFSSAQERGETVTNLRERNARLEAENRHLKERVIQLQDVENQIESLSRALNYQPPPGGELTLADVLYLDHASWVRTLVAYAPEGSPRPNDAVLTADGLVGRVIVVSGPMAKVQLLTDRAAAVGAMVQRSRHQGVVRGTGTGALELAYFSRQSDVQIGDLVVTSGIDGVFPRGVPLGTVVSVEAGSDLFHDIQLAPAVDFRTLDHVYLHSRPLDLEVVQEAGPDDG